MPNSPRWRFTHTRDIAVDRATPLVTMRVTAPAVHHRVGRLDRAPVARLALGEVVLVACDVDGSVLLDADGDVACVMPHGRIEYVSYDVLSRCVDEDALSAWKRSRGRTLDERLAAYARG